MAKFRRANADEGDEAGIDISPLIDCVFILLIFFIVTTRFVEERGMEVDKPQAAAATESEKESIVIAVNAKGEVFMDGQNIGVGGVQPAVKRRLQQEDAPVIVQTEEEARTGMAVRVIDEAKLAGAEKVTLGTTRRAN